MRSELPAVYFICDLITAIYAIDHAFKPKPPMHAEGLQNTPPICRLHRFTVRALTSSNGGGKTCNGARTVARHLPPCEASPSLSLSPLPLLSLPSISSSPSLPALRLPLSPCLSSPCDPSPSLSLSPCLSSPCPPHSHRNPSSAAQSPDSQPGRRVTGSFGHHEAVGQAAGRKNRGRGFEWKLPAVACAGIFDQQLPAMACEESFERTLPTTACNESFVRFVLILQRSGASARPVRWEREREREREGGSIVAGGQEDGGREGGKERALLVGRMRQGGREGGQGTETETETEGGRESVAGWEGGRDVFPLSSG